MSEISTVIRKYSIVNLVTALVILHPILDCLDPRSGGEWRI